MIVEELICSALPDMKQTYTIKTYRMVKKLQRKDIKLAGNNRWQADALKFIQLRGFMSIYRSKSYALVKG